MTILGGNTRTNYWAKGSGGGWMRCGVWPPNHAAFAPLHVFPRAADAVPDVRAARVVSKLLVDANKYCWR
jgi:hypothetical protein